VIKRLFAAFIVCLLYTGAAPAGGDSFSQEFSYSMLAPDRDRAIKRLLRFATEQNGYVKSYSNENVVLRLPVERVPRVREAILDVGFIGDERIKRTDMGEALVELRTRLKIRETLLANLYKLFENAAVEQTLEIEKELGKVVMEIEEIKGKTAYLEDRIAMAEVTVSINARPGARKGPSGERARWEWMNSMGIEHLMSSGDWR
jgi:hypothetical protein